MYKIVTLLTGCLALAGCGTSLCIESSPRGSDASPDGVVVNRRQFYSGKVSGRLAGKSTKISFAGVDHDDVLIVNISRKPFASGKLTLELDDRQLIRQVGITSETGAVAGANAATEVVEKRKEIREADDD